MIGPRAYDCLLHVQHNPGSKNGENGRLCCRNGSGSLQGRYSPILTSHSRQHLATVFLYGVGKPLKQLTVKNHYAELLWHSPSPFPFPVGYLITAFVPFMQALKLSYTTRSAHPIVEE